MATKKKATKPKRPVNPSRFSAALFSLMESNEWSYERMASELDTSKSQIHEWVHGDHEPTLASIRRVAEKFDFEIAELVEAA